jgi:hypothetical protein
MTRPQVLQPGLFDVPRARRDDPETSKQTADSIPLERLTKTPELVIYGLSTHGPATDEELIRVFRNRWPGSRISDQSIRSRRAELVRKGLVRDSGSRRRTQHGQRSVVWEAS